MVGVEIANASTSVNGGRVKWFGAVTRNQATGFYRNAHLFILPTLSGGFAITSWKRRRMAYPLLHRKIVASRGKWRQRNHS
jgi:hypothetical protein